MDIQNISALNIADNFITANMEDGSFSAKIAYSSNGTNMEVGNISVIVSDNSPNANVTQNIQIAKVIYSPCE